MAVTPQPGNASVVATGGTAVTAVLAVPTGVSGGFITNPLTADDQGIGSTEPLYVNPVVSATTTGNGTTFAIQPGQSWSLIPGQTTPTTVNAVTPGHRFSVVWWM